MNLNQLLKEAIKASILAGKKILEIYNNSDFQIEYKSDNSPLTIADKSSNEIIVEILKNTKIPILSEEGTEIPFAERNTWEYFWLIDPLDGTKEFIKRNGDFTVNIALIYKSKPILGVIYVPVSTELFFADINFGAFKTYILDIDNFDIDEIFLKSDKLPYKQVRNNYLVTGSRSHLSEKTQLFISDLKIKYPDLDFVSRGSSLKICMVAEGNADIYPRFGPTMEWDTAAGQAIVIASGAEFNIAGTNNDLVYNKENLLNPDFIVERKNDFL